MLLCLQIQAGHNRPITKPNASLVNVKLDISASPYYTHHNNSTSYLWYTYKLHLAGEHEPQMIQNNVPHLHSRTNGGTFKAVGAIKQELG